MALKIWRTYWGTGGKSEDFLKVTTEIRFDHNTKEKAEMRVHP